MDCGFHSATVVNFIYMQLASSLLVGVRDVNDIYVPLTCREIVRVSGMLKGFALS